MTMLVIRPQKPASVFFS